MQLESVSLATSLENIMCAFWQPQRSTITKAGKACVHFGFTSWYCFHGKKKKINQLVSNLQVVQSSVLDAADLIS